MNILLAVLVLFASAGSADDAAGFIDLEGLRAEGNDWVILLSEDTPDGSLIKLYQDKWLMFFLHWRPLTEERSNLTEEYMRDLLLNFWGEDMPFKLEGIEGETAIAGHAARYVEGTIYEGMVRTRFIVWNCPETGRQMIADCNINQRLKTPEEYLQTEYDIVAAISCHGQPVLEIEGMEVQHLEEFQLDFPIPPEWRTNVFTNEKWYPDGPSLTNGTLWTLPTDSQKYVVMQVWNDPKEPDAGLLNEWLAGLEGSDYTQNEQMQVKLGKAEIGETKEGSGLVEARLTMPFLSTYRGQEASEDYISVAYVWLDGTKTYALLAGMVAMMDVWGKPTDLTPSEETFKGFVDTILANVKPWPSR